MAFICEIRNFSAAYLNSIAKVSGMAEVKEIIGWGSKRGKSIVSAASNQMVFFLLEEM